MSHIAVIKWIRRGPQCRVELTKQTKICDSFLCLQPLPPASSLSLSPTSLSYCGTHSPLLPCIFHKPREALSCRLPVSMVTRCDLSRASLSPHRSSLAQMTFKHVHFLFKWHCDPVDTHFAHSVSLRVNSSVIIRYSNETVKFGLWCK